LTKILSIVEMDAGAVHLIDTQADKLTLMAHQGISTKYVDEFRRLNPTQGVLGQVIQTSEPIIMDDTSDNDHAVSLEGEKGEFRAYIILPVISRNAVSGTLSLASYLPKKFEWETVNLLRSMCEAIGIAVENSRTAQSLEEANKIRVQLLEKLITAQEEERRRISRELHDDASQSLAALALNLEGLADKLPPRSRDARQKLDILKEQAIHTLEGIRSLALELRPSVLDDLGLPMAVDWYARDYMAKRGLDVDIQVAGQGVKLPPYTETMLFRIIQEGLTNIVKHAEASQVKVKLQLNNSTATVQLEDDGIGFDVKAALSGEGMRQNLGLHGMSERATLLGGTLTIQSQPGQGTSLRVEVPLGKGGLSDE
jgi:signal transduction histidine kinase